MMTSNDIRFKDMNKIARSFNIAKIIILKAVTSKFEWMLDNIREDHFNPNLGHIFVGGFSSNTC